MALVRYASQAWWGYTRAKDKEELERLIERLKRQGFLSKEDMDISQRANKADQKLFQAIHSFIHAFIADIYIAPLQVGLLRSAPNPSEAE